MIAYPITMLRAENAFYPFRSDKIRVIKGIGLCALTKSLNPTLILFINATSKKVNC